VHGNRQALFAACNLRYFVLMLWIENIIRLLLVLLLQILLIDNLHFLGVVDPFLYILFLLALPVEVDRRILLLIGFAMGLVMDIFSNSLGVHTAACTALCFARPYLISNLVQEDERLVGTVDGRSLGLEVYIKYVCLLTLLHHSMVFLLSAFTLHAFWLTLIQIIVSTLITIVLLLGWEFVKNR